MPRFCRLTTVPTYPPLCAVPPISKSTIILLAISAEVWFVTSRPASRAGMVSKYQFLAPGDQRSQNFKERKTSDGIEKNVAGPRDGERCVHSARRRSSADGRLFADRIGIGLAGG